jgi:zinc protease
VRKGFDLFSDILLDPSFPPEEIDRKKELIKGSLRQKEEDPSFLAGRAIKREVFGSHPYGRLVQGSPGSIDRITRDEILRYYSGNFLPNNSILSVVGDLGATELDGLIKDFLGKWEKKRLPPRVHPAVEPMGKKVVLIDKDLTQANILIGHQGIRRDNPDYYALGIMNYILGGGGFSSRLMGSIRDEMGLAYSVYSYFSSNVEAGMFQAGVQTKNESANTVIEEILRQMTIIREQVVSASELDDAKAFLVGSFPRRLKEARYHAEDSGFPRAGRVPRPGAGLPRQIPGTHKLCYKSRRAEGGREISRPGKIRPRGRGQAVRGQCQGFTLSRRARRI